MPKQTRRGGRYTTGIKRTKSGGYGGQTTGRQGICGVIVIYGPGVVGLLMLVEAIREVWS